MSDINLNLENLINNDMLAPSLAVAVAASASASDVDATEEIVIIPPGSQANNVFEKEVESMEQLALKLKFMQELVNGAEKTNKNLPKKNNETE